MNLKETILIVDDTLTNIDILVNLLDNYDIVVATSGEEALSILDEDEHIDLILLDIMMPDMDGFEVCKTLKKNNKHKNIPVIFLTAKFDDVSIQEGFEIGAVDYIIKPFRPIELLARIKTHLKIVRHEKKIIEYNKNMAISELIQNIAHQWRQPLSVISTASSAIVFQKELNMLEDSELFEFCNKITNSTQYLSKIIDNISNILEDTNESTQIDINNIFNRNYVLFFGDFIDNKIDVDIDIEKNILLKGNRNKFIEILLAIITNSKDLLNETQLNEKLIFIKVIRKIDECTIGIFDNAGGIPVEVVDRIFEPYFTTKHKAQGKGLGLYLVEKTIKELFKGTINVSNIEFMHNHKKERGAYFEISIPLK
jgi:two-component system sensor histidine kinase/response regulator